MAPRNSDTFFIVYYFLSNWPFLIGMAAGGFIVGINRLPGRHGVACRQCSIADGKAQSSRLNGFTERSGLAASHDRGGKNSAMVSQPFARQGV
jgi:hypothetical protein